MVTMSTVPPLPGRTPQDPRIGRVEGSVPASIQEHLGIPVGNQVDPSHGQIWGTHPQYRALLDTQHINQ